MIAIIAIIAIIPGIFFNEAPHDLGHEILSDLISFLFWGFSLFLCLKMNIL